MVADDINMPSQVHEDVGRILRSSDKGSANSGGKLASWSKADPESDVVRPKDKVREGRGGRKGKKGLLGKGRGAKAKDEDNSEANEAEEEAEDGENGRRLSEESADARGSEAEQKRADMERRREELRAQKQKEIRDRYKNRDTGDFDPERYMRERDDRLASRGGDIGAFDPEDYLSERHKELRDRHRRERATSRDRSAGSSGRRDRKRPESEGRHAVLRRRIDKHAHLFSPEELAEIEDDLREHKKREDKLDAARDKLNAQFDAVRDIDDRDARLGRLEQLKQQRAAGRDAERAARDQLREDFQVIREKLEAKLRTEL